VSGQATKGFASQLNLRPKQWIRRPTSMRRLAIGVSLPVF